MSIYKNGKKGILYKDDHRPCTMYKDGVEIEGCEKKEQSGESLTFSTEYKTRLVDKVIGNSVQDNSILKFYDNEDTFTYRTTANGVGVNGNTQLRKIYGNSVRRNQLVKPINTTINGLQISTVNNKITFKGTVNDTTIIAFTSPSVGKVYCGLVNYNYRDGNTRNETIHQDKGASFPYRRIIKYTNTSILSWYVAFYNGDVVDMDIDFKLIDLTQLYNGNENIPSSIVEFNTDGSIKSYNVDKFLELNPDYNEYVPYNKGSIEGVKPKELKNVGKNVFNKNAPREVDSYSSIKFTNQNKTYAVALYEKNPNVDISGCYLAISDGPAYPGHGDKFHMIVSNGSPAVSSLRRFSDVGANHKYLSVYPSTDETWNKILSRYNIMIVEGREFAQYEPYQSSTVSTPISKYFPNGMHKVGDVRDEIDFVNKKAIQRVEYDSTNVELNVLSTTITTPIDDEDIPALYQAFNQGHEEFIYEDTDYQTKVDSLIRYNPIDEDDANVTIQKPTPEYPIPIENVDVVHNETTYTTQLEGIGNAKNEILVGYEYTDGELVPNKNKVLKHNRVGKVDLGSLNYQTSSTEWGHSEICMRSSSGINVKTDSYSSIKKNILCPIYYTDNYLNVYNATNDKTISVDEIGRIVIYDSSYTDTSSFKTAMNGVYLYYELANDTWEDITNTELGQALLNAKTLPNRENTITATNGVVHSTHFEHK